MRKLIILVAALGLGAGSLGPALAHITVNPRSAPKGSFAKLAFRTPNERDTARTVKVEVTFPDDAPIPFVSVRPVPGWTTAVEKRTLDTPVEVHGTPVTEAVSKVTWSGGSFGAGEFQEFEVSAGPLPSDADELMFRALQTYDNGEIVRWIEPTPPSGEEPDHPAPVLTLTAATGDHGGAPAGADTSDDDGDDATTLPTVLSIAALVVALVAGGVALGARRRATPTS